MTTRFTAKAMILATILLGIFQHSSLAARTVPFAEAVDTGSGPQLRDIVTADFNGDGLPDTATISEGDDRVLWQWFDGNDWLQGLITNTLVDPSGLAAGDIDCDGDPDLVIGETGTDSIVWYRNDSLGSSWSLGDVITTTASEIADLVVGHLNRDGVLDVAAVTGTDGNLRFWRRSAGCQAASWLGSPLAGNLGLISDLVIADLNGDAFNDLAAVDVSGSRVIWVESPGVPGPWTVHVVQDTLANPIELAVGDIDGDGDPDLASQLYHGAEIVWFENDDPVSNWVQHSVGSHDFPYRIALDDIDGDGDADLATASAVSNSQLIWWDNLAGDGSSWTGNVVDDSTQSLQDIVIEDLDRDGDVDLVVAAMGINRLQIYENRSSASSGVLPVELFANSFPLLPEISDLDAADIDGDGDLDLAIVERDNTVPIGRVRWLENLGTTSSGELSLSGREYVLTDTLRSLEQVVVGDVNQDGIPDLMASYFVNVAVHAALCLGSGSPTWACSDVISLAGQIVKLDALELVDIDRDGDLDLLSTVSDGLANDTIVWFEQDGDPTLSASWIRRDIGIGGETEPTLSAVDLDGDGDLDVVGSRNRWWRQTTGGWTAETIAGDVMSSRMVADLDLDGDPDLAAVILTAQGVGLAWFENDGTAGSFVQHVVRPPDTTAPTVSELALIDLDGDGDEDLASGRIEAGQAQSLWYENRLREAAAWSEHPMLPAGFAPGRMIGADLDRDGRADLLATDVGQVITSWLNGGGQFALASTSFGTLGLGNGESTAVMTIDLDHRGRSGQSPLALARLALLFENTPGTPLAQSDLDGVLTALTLYRDDGSGDFEEASDTLVASWTPPTLDQGLALLPLPAADPNLELDAGAPSVRYFLAIELSGDAGSQAIDQFRIVHAPEAGSVGLNADFQTPLRLEYTLSAVATILIQPPSEDQVFSDRFEAALR